jgi:Fe-S-cluster containining protein
MFVIAKGARKRSFHLFFSKPALVRNHRALDLKIHENKSYLCILNNGFKEGMKEMEKRLAALPKLAKDVEKESLKYFQRLKRRVPKNLDVVMQELHEEEFEKTDCLDCANCCRTSSPIFTEKDIQRIARHFRMKEVQFIAQFLDRDSDDFYVLKTVPCHFLNENDNSCTIYDVRPKACAEYPHTNRRKFFQITDLTVTNASICPAAYNIVENVKKRLPLVGKPQTKFRSKS